jgi:nitronate monooxygenase
VGTAFAFCHESGLLEAYKRELLAKTLNGQTKVFTDPLASPTGFPFKVAQLEGTLSDPSVYAARPRICDLGFLREAFRTDDGQVDYRCPGEPATLYVSKGGKLEDTVGRKCLCNALVANIGLPQVRNGKHLEQPLITSGDDLKFVTQFLPQGQLSYSAADVVATLMGGLPDFSSKQTSKPTTVEQALSS